MSGITTLPPREDGFVCTYSATDSLCTLAAPDSSIRVSAILP